MRFRVAGLGLVGTLVPSCCGKYRQYCPASVLCSAPMLTKSLLLEQLRCPKALWLALHGREHRAPSNAFVKRLKSEGQALGALARGRYPGGVLIEAEAWDSEEALLKTTEAMEQEVPAIFEATFQSGGVLVKVDLLVRGKHGWSIVEVKATTKLKKTEHVPDVAAQWWVLKRTGVKLESAFLMHVRPGAEHATAAELFEVEDITHKVVSAQERMHEEVWHAKQVMARTEAPYVPMGVHCDKPRVCDFFNHCQKASPLPSPSVFELPRIGVKKWDYLQAGLAALSDVPVHDLNETQQHIREVILSGERFVDREALSRGTAQWGFPMLHLDFETCSWAIPPFEGLAPYTQVPVQYSLHVELDATSEPLHFEFLHDGQGDPRPQVGEALAEHLGPYLTEGASVMAYSMEVERNGLQCLAEATTAGAEILLEAAQRLVDPLPLLRSHVYDAAFRGSFSIKSVAPALLGEAFNYDLLVIHHGAEAMARYDELRTAELSPEERKGIQADLLEYCSQDTLAMLELVRWIRRESRP